MPTPDELIDELLLIASRRNELHEELDKLKINPSTRGNEKRSQCLAELNELNAKEEVFKAQIQPDIQDALKQRIQAVSKRTEQDQRLVQLSDERIEIESKLSEQQLSKEKRKTYQIRLNHVVSETKEINKLSSRRIKLHRLLTLLEHNIHQTLNPSPPPVEKSRTSRLNMAEPEIELQSLREDAHLLIFKLSEINKKLIQIETELTSLTEPKNKNNVEQEKRFLIEQRHSLQASLAYLQTRIDEKLAELTIDVDLRTSRHRLTEVFRSLEKERKMLEGEIQSLDAPLKKEELKNELKFLGMQITTIGDMLNDIDNKILNGSNPNLNANRTYRSILKHRDTSLSATPSQIDTQSDQEKQGKTNFRH
jgi:hypothetical protein